METLPGTSQQKYRVGYGGVEVGGREELVGKRGRRNRVKWRISTEFCRTMSSEWWARERLDESAAIHTRNPRERLTTENIVNGTPKCGGKRSHTIGEAQNKLWKWRDKEMAQAIGRTGDSPLPPSPPAKVDPNFEPGRESFFR